MTCSGCGVELPGSALSCPQCRTLVHAEKLGELAGRAGEAWRLGRFPEERALWAESLQLLPEDTVQYQSIANRVAELDAQFARVDAEAITAGPEPTSAAEKLGFLLRGLTSGTTFVSMLISLFVYSRMEGWAAAAGLVVSIYIHEMGHLSIALRYRVPASPPIFIPGLGAFIGLRVRKISPIVNSRVGLGGPIYGLGAAMIAVVVYYVTRERTWGLIAHSGAFLNLLNLIPIWQLDGSRGISSLTRGQRAIVAGTAAVLFAILKVKLLLAVMLVSIYRLFTRDWPDEPDAAATMQFAWLLIALALVMSLAPGTGDLLGDATSSLR